MQMKSYLRGKTMKKIFSKLLIGITAFLVVICGDNQIYAQITPNNEARSVNSDTKEQTNASSGIQYKYDKLNRVTEVIYADGSKITYVYDKNGNIKESKVDAVLTPTPIPTVEPTTIPTPIPTEVPVQRFATIFYKRSSSTGWKNAYIHYRVNGVWTTVPGVSMDKVSAGYWKITIDIGNSEEVLLSFNNGSGSWDSNSDKYYSISDEGSWLVDQTKKTVSKMKVTPTPTVKPTKTPKPATPTPKPKKTATPKPKKTATPKPKKTATPKPKKTATPKPKKTATPKPKKTATPKPSKTATPKPKKTATPKPSKTATPKPKKTATPKPKK